MYNRRTPLIRIQQNMTSGISIETVIGPIVYPLHNEIGLNFIRMASQLPGYEFYLELVGFCFQSHPKSHQPTQNC